MPKLTKKSSRPKTLYRVENWSEYEKALVQRGSITFWLSEDVERVWLYTGEKQRGSQFEYSEKAIEIMLTIKEVFHLSNRSVEGFVRSVFAMLDLPLLVPDHSTLSKRGKTFDVRLPKKTNGSLNLVLDSTGKASGRFVNMGIPSTAPGANCMWEPIPIPARSRW